jgi:flagellar motor switch protein FliM
MADGGTSVLAKKIEAARKKAGGSVDLTGFTAALQSAVAKAASALIEEECKAAATARAGALADLLAGGADPGVYYWLADSSGEPALLIAVNPAFASLLTIRLLGGELSAPAVGAATTIDFEMSASLIDTLLAPLNLLFDRTKKTSLAASGRRGARTFKETLRDRERTTGFAFAIDLDIGGASLDSAVTLIFTEAFLQKAGLVGGGASESKTNAAEWARRLRRNLLAVEIPLTVVLDRVSTNVGELSRLQVGQVIDIDANALQRLDIAASTSAGPASVARGRLGSWQARKAVKLTTEVDADFLSGL